MAARAMSAVSGRSIWPSASSSSRSAWRALSSSSSKNSSNSNSNNKPAARRRTTPPPTAARAAAPWRQAGGGGDGDPAARGPAPNDADDSPSPDAPMRTDLRVVLFRPQIPQNAGNVARTAAATGVPLELVAPLGFRVDDAKLKRAGLDYWRSVCARVHEPRCSGVPRRRGEGSAEEGSGGGVKKDGDDGDDDEHANDDGGATERAGGEAEADGWPALLEAFDAAPSPKRLVAFTVYGATHYAAPSFAYQPGDWLLFGSETDGLPPRAHGDVLSRGGALVKIPMRGGARSAVRSLNLATCVGVGVFEALRQLDAGRQGEVEPRDDSLWRETPMAAAAAAAAAEGRAADERKREGGRAGGRARGAAS